MRVIIALALLTACNEPIAVDADADPCGVAGARCCDAGDAAPSCAPGLMCASSARICIAVVDGAP